VSSVRSLGGGGVTVVLTEPEFAALTKLEADLMGTLAQRLQDVSDGTVREHPLFPDAYSADPEAAREFHSLTDVDLAGTKSDGARRIMDAFSAAPRHDWGPPWRRVPARTVEFDAELAHALLRNLTDLRLLTAERLGIEHDEDLGRPGEEFALDRALYWWLGETQEALVQALAGGLL